MQLGKKRIWNVLLFLVERKYLLSKDNLINPNLWVVVLLSLYFFEKSLVLPKFYLVLLYSVGHGFCEAKLHLSP